MSDHPTCAAATAASRAPLPAAPTPFRRSLILPRPPGPCRWQAVRSALGRTVSLAAGSAPGPGPVSALRAQPRPLIGPAFSGLCLALGLALATPAAAEALPPAEGPVVLTLTGALSHANDGAAVTLDIAALEALPRHEITTSTVWTEGTSTYSGVLLQTLLDIVGAEGSRLVASAIDGYEVVIPLAEIHADGPIIAFLRDGAPMPVRARGPLWIIYPFDDNPAFRNDTTYARSIWQLTRIVIED